jgi:hypothetical protein
MKQHIIFLFSFLLLGISCQGNKNRAKIGQIISEWTGKQIQFPENYFCNILGKDTVSTFCTGLFDKEYKVLLYIDSTGCFDCQLKLYEWKRLIFEADSLFQDKLGFVFFFQSKSKKEMSYLFKRDNFTHPVFIDTDNSIERLNHFPSQPEYQCFLLDKNNKVLMLGNPVLNPKIWELYKQTIAGEKQASKQEELTTAQADKTIHDYGTIRKGSAHKAVFRITNTGAHPLLIHQVSASCGCTNVSWDKRPVKPGGTATVSAEMTPDETGCFNKTIDVHCNVAETPLKLTLIGTAE